MDASSHLPRSASQPKAPTRRTRAERDALDRAEAERKRNRESIVAAEAAVEAVLRTQQYGVDPATRGGAQGGLRRTILRGVRSDGRHVQGVERSKDGAKGGRDDESTELVMQAATSTTVSGTEEKIADSLVLNDLAAQRIEAEAATAARGKKKARGRTAAVQTRVRGGRRGREGRLGAETRFERPQEPEFMDDNSVDMDADHGRSIDVDELHLIISSDEDEIRMADANTLPRIRRRDFLPVRLPRKEHAPQQTGINVEASSTMAAELRKQAEERGQAPGYDEALASVTRKLRTKDKDYDFFDVSTNWKGVYRDEDDNDIKREETAVDDTMDIDSSAEPDREAETESPPKPGAKGKPCREPKKRTDSQLPAPHFTSRPHQAFSSADEQAELNRIQASMRTIREDLGTLPTVAAATPSRENTVYLFQFPPIIPDLLLSSDSNIEMVDSDTKAASGTKAPVDVKLEETLDKLGGEDGYKEAQLRPGWAGTLNIHESGRASISWGGADMGMRVGTLPSFLQTVVMVIAQENETPVEPEAPKARVGRGKQGVKVKKESEVAVMRENVNVNVPEQQVGEVVSLGQVRGKFIVTPEFGEMMG